MSTFFVYSYNVEGDDMFNYIFYCILWTFALYGFIDLMWILWCRRIHKRIETSGIYVIVAVKNQEQRIELFLRSFLHKFIFDREQCIDNLMVVDLSSEDNTKAIVEKMSEDHDEIKVVEWEALNRIMEIQQKNKSL